jgi:hypothetical protein
MNPKDKWKHEEALIRATLLEYVKKHGCPCAWEQFEYWASKEVGNGWHDEYQNVLAESAITLDCFEQRVVEQGYDVYLSCKNCGRQWHYTSEEWRMLAFRNRLVPVIPRALQFEAMTGAWFSTVGFQPNDIKSLNIDEWRSFMLGKHVEPVDIPETSEATLKNIRKKWWQKIFHRT